MKSHWKYYYRSKSLKKKIHPYVIVINSENYLSWLLDNTTISCKPLQFQNLSFTLIRTSIIWAISQNCNYAEMLVSGTKLKIWVLDRGLLSFSVPLQGDCMVDMIFHSLPCPSRTKLSSSWQHQEDDPKWTSSLSEQFHYQQQMDDKNVRLSSLPLPTTKSFWYWCNSKLFLMALATTSNRIRAGEIKLPRSGYSA